MTDTRSTSARRTASPPPGGRAASTRPGGRPGKAPVGSWPVRERSLIKPVLGIPPVVAVAIAFGLTALGVLVDLLRIGTVGSIFEVGYFLGCVLAVAWVRRRSIFVPAIQPPLLLAVVVPLIAVLIGAPAPEAGATEHLLMAGAPLINAFPAMAVTTVAVLLLAGFRLLRQRTGPDDAFGQIRRRLPGGRAEDSAPGGTAGRDGTSGRGRAAERDGVRPRATAPPKDRARPKSGDGAPGGTRSGERGSGRGQRTSAPDAATRASGTPSGGSRPARATDRATPRTGGSSSSTGSARSDEPARPRRPRRS